MNALRRLAARAPVPVFAAVGRDARERVEDLSLAPGIACVSSSRHASVLLVAGSIRAEDRQALRHLHDQLPHPRATLWWGAEAFEGMAQLVTLPITEDPVPPLRELHRQLLSGQRKSEPDLLPNEPPARWRGLGEHGQGGEGMMGGQPYGRPMAMTDDDLRDGLALDAYRVQIGPFMPTLPAGLMLELTLQGDVIQRAEVIRPPLPPTSRGTIAPDNAHRRSSSIVERERTRASHHLRCIARILVILQLAPQAERCWRAAQSVSRGESVTLNTLRQALRRAGAFAAIPARLGLIDASLDSPWMVEQREDDVRTRLVRWLSEAEQALDASGRSGELPENIALPRAHLRITDLLRGLEWNEALLVIASVDIETLCGMCPDPVRTNGDAKDGAR